MSEKKVIGTDNNGNSKIRINSDYTVNLQITTQDDDDDWHEINFDNIFDFIEYISEHGKEILENIDNGEYEYNLQIDFGKNNFNYDFIYLPILSTGHQSIGIEIDGSFIADEIKGDKQALHDIMDIAYKRTNWGQARGK